MHCPCGFTGFEYGRFTSAWHVAHRDRHISVFPDVDMRTRCNLTMAIEEAMFAETLEQFS